MRERIPILTSENYVRRVLPPVLTNFDFTMSFMMVMFFVSNPVGTIASGAVSLLYWGIGALIFFIPCVLVVAQLCAWFPVNGSSYNWTHKALGGFWSLFAAVTFWIPGVVAMVSAASIGITIVQSINPHLLVEPWQQGLAVIAILIFACIISLQPLRTFQHVVNFVTPLTYAVVLLLGIAAVVWLLGGHSSATPLLNPATWAITPDNFKLFGIVVLAYLGADVPVIVLGEAKQPEKGYRHFLWGTLAVLGAYFILTMALLVVIGPEAATLSNASILIALERLFGPVVARIAAACLLVFFPLFVALTGSLFARLLMTISADRRLPIGLVRLNKHRVPVNAILTQTAIAIGFTLLLYFVPYVFSMVESANLALEVQVITLSVLVLIWAVSSAFLFISLLVLMKRYPELLKKGLIVPKWLLQTCCYVALIACAVAIVNTLAYNLLAPLINDTMWRVFVGSLTVVCLFVAYFGCVFATTEAAWQDKIHEVESGF